jgi:hypothetical protein
LNQCPASRTVWRRVIRAVLYLGEMPDGSRGATVRLATIREDGWQLESAEARHAANPDTFWIPARDQRERLQSGDGAKLLFQIQSAAGSTGVERGVERLWVIVRRRVDGGYVGVLDSTPASTDAASSLARGCDVGFAPEHIADISAPPREYVIAHYGGGFFD